MPAPVYSHVEYDIVPGESVAVRQPDILILEGLNVLQVGLESNEFVSDYFDFSIFIDAEERHIEQWYVNRFLKLRETVFQDPMSLLPPLRRPQRVGGDRHRPLHLEHDQRQEPPREHRADARCGPR